MAVKEDSLKRFHSGWFYLHETIKKTKLVNKVERGDIWLQSMGEFGGMIELYADCGGGGYTYLYIC